MSENQGPEKKNLKETRKKTKQNKTNLISRGTKVRIKSDFSVEPMQTKENEVFSVERKKPTNPALCTL